MDPSWHHNYASLGWFDLKEAEHKPHYPETRPELVQLISALHAIAHEPEARTAWYADAGAYADRYRLAPDQREALIKLDVRRHRCDGRASAGAVPGEHADRPAAAGGEGG